MKNLFLIAAIFCSFYTTAQVTVTIDPTIRIKTLNGFENGINLNYLTDGTYVDSLSNTTSALKRMGVKMLRYPGGEKSDNYLFSGFPWKESSPRMASKDNRGWPTSDTRFIDTSSADKHCLSKVLDFDEMVKMAKEIEAEPLIVVAYDVIHLDYGSGAPALRPTKTEMIEHAIEWVRYANIKKKYGIKYWMIGNESWNHPDYNGQTTATQYAIDLYEFAVAMKAVDPTIKIVANGERSWWPTIIRSPAVKLIDILAFSSYPVWNYKGGYSYYKNNNVVLTGELDAAIRAIETYATGADKERLKVMPSEYNAIDWSGNWENSNDLGHALCNFQMFGDMLLKPRVEALCNWNTRWTDIKEDAKTVYNALDETGNLNATGIAMEIWGKNLLNTMVSSISNHSKVKTYASYDTLSGALNILILNKDSLNYTAHIDVDNYDMKYGGSKMAFSGISAQDKSPRFVWREAIIGEESLYNVELQAMSITVIKLFSPYITLPLQLKSFVGVTDGVKNKLSWYAENENSLAGYVVERLNKQNGYMKIGYVQVKDEYAGYSFFDFDADLNPVSYYRLQLVFKNGTTKYSDVIVVDRNRMFDFSIKIFPNPFNNKSNLQIYTTKKMNLEVRAFDLSGNLIYSKRFTVTKETSEHSLKDFSKLKSGVYFLQVEGEGLVKNLKVVKN